jgi:hypothetical protein
VSERRLSKARRTVQQDMVQRLATQSGGLYRDREFFDELALTDVLSETRRSQRPVELPFFSGMLFG